MKVLVTCPPMLGMIDEFRALFDKYGIELTTPEIVQTLSEDTLKELVAEHDGWIIGDDPATRAVFESGKAGKLKAAVKWGVGTDNVDFTACSDLGIPVSNTPGMFGREVADIAVGYVIALARETFHIDRNVREGLWPKPPGISLAGRTVALLGLGDIGRNIAKRLLAADMRIVAYDPHVHSVPGLESIEIAKWPRQIEEADFIVVACALSQSSRHMINDEILAATKRGVRIVNVGRGPIIDESALSRALDSGQVHSAALDVFEVEPLPTDSPLRRHNGCVFGSHNSSNTVDAVRRTSDIAVDKLLGFLGAKE